MKAMNACLLAFFAAMSIVPAAAAAPHRTSDVDQIRALEERIATAFVAKDVDAIMKNYVPDETLFVFDIVPPRQYVGAKAYHKDWQDFLTLFKGPVKFDVQDLAVETSGNFGWGHCVEHVSGIDTKGKPVDFTLRVTDVYRKIKGTWLIVHEHISVPVDVDSGKPDFTSKP